MGAMRIAAVVTAIVVAVAAGAAARAADRPLVVGVEELEYLPAYAFENGHYSGAAADIITAFARDQGYAVTFKPLPILRLYAEEFRGGIDLKFPDSPDWRPDLRAGHAVVYSVPVLFFVDGVMVRPENKGHGIERMKSLGTVQGFTVAPEFKQRIDSGAMELRENPKLGQLLKQVVLGRVDGAYASVAGAKYVLAHELDQENALVFDRTLPYDQGAYTMSSSLRPEVIAEFNTWVLNNKAAIAAIAARWKVDGRP